MKRQRGQSAVEFALIAPMILFIILAAFYGGAMFIQFLNFNNDARTIARQIAVADSSVPQNTENTEGTEGATQQSERQKLIEHYNNIGEQECGLYMVKPVVEIINDGEDVRVTFNFNRREGSSPFFGFPPPHFATSYIMKLE